MKRARGREEQKKKSLEKKCNKAIKGRLFEI